VPPPAADRRGGEKHNGGAICRHPAPFMGRTSPMKNILVLSTIAAFAIGCSSSSDSTPATTDSGTTVADTGGVANDTGTSSGADTGPTGCWLTHQAQAGCDECLRNECKSEAESCYGQKWTTSTFTGSLCADYAACICACKENDNFCLQQCGLNDNSTNCNQCRSSLRDCLTNKCAATCSTN
jgi:hypothetical protein